MSQLSNTTTTTIPCSTGFFTTKKECTIDPIVELFENMVKGAINVAFSDLQYSDVIARLLDKGVIQETCDYCCPDCGNIYVFAGKEAFMDLAQELGWAESAAVPA